MRNQAYLWLSCLALFKGPFLVVCAFCRKISIIVFFFFVFVFFNIMYLIQSNFNHVISLQGILAIMLVKFVDLKKNIVRQRLSKSYSEF